MLERPVSLSLKSRLSRENQPTQVTENLGFIESASADLVSAVAVLTAGYFSNALLIGISARGVLTNLTNNLCAVRLINVLEC
jgi:hypothetical protein